MTVVDSVANGTDDIFTTIVAYMSSHQDGITAVALLLGVIITFSGRTLLRPAVFLLGFFPIAFLLAAFGVAFIHDQFPDHSYTPYLDVAAVILALILAFLVGLVMIKLLFTVIVFTLCALMGAILVLIISLFFWQPDLSRNVQLIWFAATILASLLSALLSVTFPTAAIILGTAIDGAALAVFSVASFLGHRPPLLTSPPPPALDDALPDDALPDDDQPLPVSDFSHWWAVAYAISAITLATFGALIQSRVAIADYLKQQQNLQQQQQQQQNLHRDDDNEQTSLLQHHNTTQSSSVLIPVHPDTLQPYNAQVVATLLPDMSKKGSRRAQLTNSRFLLLPGPEDPEQVTVIEPPSSPSYRRSGSVSPQPSSSYGAADSHDAQYSVVHNLGALPLPSDPHDIPAAPTTSRSRGSAL